MQIEDFDVIVIGAGVSGIGMGCALKAQCPDKQFVILERRRAIGGTWDLFRYPGVRSDSDMFTYGYQRRPWTDTRVLADGATIRAYLADTARTHRVDAHIRFGVQATHAEWSSSEQRWTITAGDEGGTAPQRLRCKMLVMGTGYYDHDAGHTPELPEIDRFDGRVVHPQQWPQQLDYQGKRVVVVGSGATAVTLVPALAEGAAHVTMLQRSPSYFFSVPANDPLIHALSRVLPRGWAFAMARRRNLLLAHWLYQACRRWPARMRKFLLGQVRRQLGSDGDMRHFTPAYQPWDQRLCIVPDADLFKSVRSGKASVATDQIRGFAGRKILLSSGAELEADILVTATGLELLSLGGMQVAVDHQPYLPQRHMLYKGVLMEDLPNFAWIVGYTNASWTLKVDLATSYICRLIRHLDEHGLGVAVPRDREGVKLDESILGNLSSGYIRRGAERVPRQGSKAPWRVTHHYPSDKAMLQHQPIDDGVLCFEARRDSDRRAVNPAGEALAA